MGHVTQQLCSTPTHVSHATVPQSYSAIHEHFSAAAVESGPLVLHEMCGVLFVKISTHAVQLFQESKCEYMGQI